MSDYVSSNDSNDSGPQQTSQPPPAAYPPLPSSSQQQQPARSSLRSSHVSAGNLKDYARDHLSAGESLEANAFAKGRHEQQRAGSIDSTPVPAPPASSATTSSYAKFSSSSANATGNSVKPKQQAPSRIQFCSRNLLAGINLAAPTVNSRTEGANQVVIGSTNRGPRLLELWRLEETAAAKTLSELPAAEDTQTGGYPIRHLFTMRPIAYSCSNPSFGMSLTSTCLEVQPETLSLSSSSSGTTMKVATGLTTGALCLHSFAGAARDGDQDDDADEATFQMSMDLFHASPRYHRPATAVAWSPRQANHVAIGLVGPNHHQSSIAGAAGGVVTAAAANSSNSSSSSPSFAQQQGGLRSTSAQSSSSLMRQSSGPSGGGDREYCCYLWDIEHQQQAGSPTLGSSSPILGTSAGRAGGGGGRGLKSTVPLFKLSYQMGVASLGWVLEDGQTLAVGGQLRNLHLYDLRVDSSQQQYQQTPVVSVYAHNFGVHGIESDPFRPWQFASFCRAANEPVKIWDARMMDTVVSEIKIAGQGGSSSSSNEATTALVMAVKWSMTEAGRIAVAVGDIVHEYDTAIAASRPVHANSTYLQDPVLDFCLYPYSVPDPSTDAATSGSSILPDLLCNRLVAATDERKLVDVARNTQAPIAISPRDGRVAHGFGRALWVGSPSTGPSAMESLRIQNDEDISSTMMRRARCQHVAKYCMNASANIKVLAEDGFTAEPVSSLPSRLALLRLWSWIERVETLCAESASEDLWADGMAWQAKGLIDAGAWRLIQEDHGKEGDVEMFSDQLACTTYDSPGRRAALTSCGWAGKSNLVSVLGECDDLEEYERGAALAIWHGNIEAAVSALERGSEAIRVRIQEKRAGNADMQSLLAYAETLELVGLCIAGYRGGEAKASASAVWRRSCAKLMQRDALAADPGQSTGQVAYLQSILSFLMSIGSDSSHSKILHDSSISLCDRIGFACRFLARKKLVAYLEKCIEVCQSTGDVEGVTVTGLDKHGIVILQSYVDKYADVQTAALVTSRVILPPEFLHERRVCEEWLDCYRTLLNSWQMWQSRAMFDVDRADLLRQVKARQGSAASSTKTPMATSNFQGSSATKNRNAGALGTRKHQGPRPIDPDIQASVPCQLDARCNYCNSALGLKSQDTHASQWLSKMKPVLSCCPQCRKPLPRCAICLLSLGTLNPYMELTKDRSRSTVRGGSTGSSVGDLSSLANLPFGEWFSWCMRCKHGGHAHHLVGWFAKHETCPVSGCNCACQFDGIQKLRRSASSDRRALDKGNDEP